MIVFPSLSIKVFGVEFVGVVVLLGVQSVSVEVFKFKSLLLGLLVWRSYAFSAEIVGVKVLSVEFVHKKVNFSRVEVWLHCLVVKSLVWRCLVLSCSMFGFFQH